MKKYLQIAVFILIFCVLLFHQYIYLFIYSLHDPVNDPPVLCETEGGEVYCKQFYADDGLVRFTVKPTDKQNCCRIKREVTFPDGQKPNRGMKTVTSYDEMVCTTRPLQAVDCSKFDKYLSLYTGIVVIDGQFLDRMTEKLFFDHY